jgi:hypothetical protein
LRSTRNEQCKTAIENGINFDPSLYGQSLTFAVISGALSQRLRHDGRSINRLFQRQAGCLGYQPSRLGRPKPSDVKKPQVSKVKVIGDNSPITGGRI